MSGVPCIRGTRIPVSVIVGRIAEGLSTEEIIAEFPQVAAEDVAAAVEFAAAAVDLRELSLGTVKAGTLREPRPAPDVGSLRAPLVGPTAGGSIRALPGRAATDGTPLARSMHVASAVVTNDSLRHGRVGSGADTSDTRPGERVEVLSSELVVVPDAVATELRIPRGGWAIRRRQLTVNGTGPLELSTSWFDGRLADRAPRLLEPANVREGTVAYLQKVTSHRAAKTHNVITVRHASAEEKRLLRLAGSRPPVVITRHLVADIDGAPMEFVETVQAPERWAATAPEPTERDPSAIPLSQSADRRPAGIASRLLPRSVARLTLPRFALPSRQSGRRETGIPSRDQPRPRGESQPRDQADRQDRAQPWDQVQPWDQAQPPSRAQPQDQDLPEAVRHLAGLPTSLPDAMSASERSWPAAKEWLGTYGPWLVLCVLALILIVALGLLATAPYLWTWA